MKPLAIKGLVWSAVALALLGTLTLYQRPEFLVSLADQVWSCF
jgi:hypothetical protein